MNACVTYDGACETGRDVPSDAQEPAVAYGIFIL